MIAQRMFDGGHRSLICSSGTLLAVTFAALSGDGALKDLLVGLTQPFTGRSICCDRRSHRETVLQRTPLHLIPPAV